MIINSYRYGGGGDAPFDFSGASRIFSVRKLNTSLTNAHMQLRRSSDSATCWLFFDGAIAYDEINVNAYTAPSSRTTPTTTTLATWAGSDDVVVIKWVEQISGTGVGDLTPRGTTVPQLMSAGSLITKNGKPSIEFDGTTAFTQATPYSELDSGNSFSIFTVSSNDSTTNKNKIFHTGRITANAFSVWSDSSGTAEMAYAYGTTTSATTNYSTTINTTNQRLISTIKTSTLSSWYNGGVESETGVTHSGTYTNDEVFVGQGRLALPDFLDGHVQEVIIYAVDQSSNLAAIEADINGYYSIY